MPRSCYLQILVIVLVLFDFLVEVAVHEPEVVLVHAQGVNFAAMDTTADAAAVRAVLLFMFRTGLELGSCRRITRSCDAQEASSHRNCRFHPERQFRSG